MQTQTRSVGSQPTDLEASSMQGCAQMGMEGFWENVGIARRVVVIIRRTMCILASIVFPETFDRDRLSRAGAVISLR